MAGTTIFNEHQAQLESSAQTKKYQENLKAITDTMGFAYKLAESIGALPVIKKIIALESSEASTRKSVLRHLHGRQAELIDSLSDKLQEMGVTINDAVREQMGRFAESEAIRKQLASSSPEADALAKIVAEKKALKEQLNAIVRTHPSMKTGAVAWQSNTHLEAKVYGIAGIGGPPLTIDVESHGTEMLIDAVHIAESGINIEQFFSKRDESSFAGMKLPR